MSTVNTIFEDGLENARVIRAGTDDRIVKWKDCPDCGGRGYFRTNPFAAYNARYVQCPLCESAKEEFDHTGKLPNKETP